MDTSSPIKHIAFIMDGNRRWAKRHNLPIAAGHRKGAETLTDIAKAAKNMGIKYMTVYAFSTENWGRAKEEVNALMDLLRHYLDSGFKELQKEYGASSDYTVALRFGLIGCYITKFILRLSYSSSEVRLLHLRLIRDLLKKNGKLVIENQEKYVKEKEL